MPDLLQNLTPTLLSHFEVLYLPHRLAGGSDSTIRQYKASFKNFSRYLASLGIERDAEIGDLQDHLVHSAAHWLVKKRHRKPHTALKMQDNLLSLWRFLAEKHVVPNYPDVTKIEVPDLIPTAWSKPQLSTLWKACQSQRGTICGVEAAGWWHALHSVLWDTGERISAIMLCRIDTDLDIEGRYLHVRAHYRKGKKADQLYRLHRDTILLLRAILEPRRELIFPWPLDPVSIWYHYDRLLKRAGLPSDRYHKFHCLRRSTASWLEAAGGDATQQLGHSSRRITMKYLDPRIVKKKQASDVLFRPGKSKRAG